MSQTGTPTRERILSAAYRLFYKEGFARVSIDAIAESSRVTKRTLYYHFESKDELAGEVLRHQHKYALSHIKSWYSESAKTASEFVIEMFDNLENWACEPFWYGSGFTRITMELADMPGHPARGAASLHKNEVEVWLTSELARLAVDNPHEIARQLLLLIEGAMSLIMIHGDVTYAKSAARAAKQLVDVRQR